MDECKADPCAVAAELKERSPRTIIHFIALGEKSEEKLGEMACMPEQTGGVFLTAQDEAELNDALQQNLSACRARRQRGSRRHSVAPIATPPIVAD